MNIIVLGANGSAGSAIVEEALNRDITVTAAFRNPDRSDLHVDSRANMIHVDANSEQLVAEAAKGCQVAVNATKTPQELVKMNKTIIEGLKTAEVDRLIVIGGAGSLLTDNNKRLVHQPNFPEKAYDLGLAHLNLRKFYETTNPEIDWVYIIPPPKFIKNGPRSTTYHFVQDELTSPESDHYEISYLTYAVAIVDEIVDTRYSCETLLVTE